MFAKVDQKFCNWGKNLPVLVGRLIHSVEFWILFSIQKLAFKLKILFFKKAKINKIDDLF